MTVNQYDLWSMEIRLVHEKSLPLFNFSIEVLLLSSFKLKYVNAYVIFVFLLTPAPFSADTKDTTTPDF